ncbi:MAG: ABC transporter ATP-binding protein [Proteobacteria bacterium]|nr:ABC transporter ATP-binding protein [Pseudomonadota bacterium]
MTGDDIDVRLAGVTKTFGAVAAVRDVSLEIPRGSIFSLLGPSGCGKTTTLRLIAGFEQPTQGQVYIRGRDVTDVPPYRRDFSIVFQSYALFPHLTVAENVGFGPRMRGVGRAVRGREVAEALALVKLAGYEARYPRELSGGQQQRVALARAIVVRPAVLLLDEPLGALDKMLREEMQVELRQLQQRLGITAVFVTHDQEEALTLSDHVAVMRDGRIEQVGAPRAIYERPDTEFVAGFLGASNFFDGVVVARDTAGAEIEVAGWRVRMADVTAAVGAQVRIAVRPERMRLGGPDAPGQPATVREIVYRGSTIHYYLDGAAGPILVHRQNAEPGAAELRPGDRVRCRWAPESGVVFAPK